MRIAVWCCSISGGILVLFVAHGSADWLSWKVKEVMWPFINEAVKKLSA